MNGNGKFDGCAVDACPGPFGQPGDLPVVESGENEIPSYEVYVRGVRMGGQNVPLREQLSCYCIIRHLVLHRKIKYLALATLGFSSIQTARPFTLAAFI